MEVFVVRGESTGGDALDSKSPMNDLLFTVWSELHVKQLIWMQKVILLATTVFVQGYQKYSRDLIAYLFLSLLSRHS